LRKALVCPRRSILSGADTTLALVLATTRPAGRVVQVGLGGGTTHHDRTQDNQAGGVGVGIVVGNIRELCEVIALVERGPLEPIPLEFCPLNLINEVYEGSSAMRWRVARY
jgi:D-arabinose 1-dehydrogenase-like Zn-dependent alcohol dehydrogenase